MTDNNNNRTNKSGRDKASSTHSQKNKSPNTASKKTNTAKTNARGNTSSDSRGSSLGRKPNPAASKPVPESISTNTS